MKRVLKRRGRDKLHIMAEIVEIAKDGALKTHIMYRANLSYKDMTAYLRLMLRTKLLKKIKISGKKGYKSTGKGIVFLEHYREVVKFVREEEENETI